MTSLFWATLLAVKRGRITLNLALTIIYNQQNDVTQSLNNISIYKSDRCTVTRLTGIYAQCSMCVCDDKIQKNIFQRLTVKKIRISSKSQKTRSTASNIEQAANLLRAQANSASYPQRDGKWVVATATGWRPSVADLGDGVSASCIVGPIVR